MSNTFEYNTEWAYNRVQFILDLYGTEFFKGKTLLELGSMWGEMGHYFKKCGAEVTCYEGRKENYEKSLLKFPDLNTKLVNIENIVLENNYDIIFNMGILYHLETVDNLLKQCAKSCRYMILETEVIDSAEDRVLDLIDAEGYDQAVSVNRLGKRPSAIWVENRLQELGFKYIRHDSTKLDSGPHIYSWKSVEDNSYHVARRRFWSCEKIS